MSLVAALLLTLAIVTHHFTAMGAVEIVPDPLQTPAALSLSPAFLAVVIAGVALSVLGMSLVGVLADRRLALRTRRFEDIISQLSLARQQVEASQGSVIAAIHAETARQLALAETSRESFLRPPPGRWKSSAMAFSPASSFLLLTMSIPHHTAER